MKLSKTGIGLLTNQYRSVLRKCALINAGLFFALAPSVAGASIQIKSGDSYSIVQNEDGSLYFNWGSIEAETGRSINGPYMDSPLYYINSDILELAGLRVAKNTMSNLYTLTNDYNDPVRSEAFTLASVINLDTAVHNIDTQVAANTSTIAAHTAVINALDNNYYRNIEVSRAEKYKKSPLAERSECIQGSTDFFKKFEDALTIAAQSRHDGLIFVANDNATTTGNTTMYKKEA